MTHNLDPKTGGKIEVWENKGVMRAVVWDNNTLNCTVHVANETHRSSYQKLMDWGWRRVA